MAGRVTIVAGTAPVLITGMDATNATPAYSDVGLTTPVNLPMALPAGSAVILYVTDTASITPTIKDSSGTHTLSAVATACRAGLPVLLGPFNWTPTSTIA